MTLVTAEYVPNSDLLTLAALPRPTMIPSVADLQIDREVVAAVIAASIPSSTPPSPLPIAIPEPRSALTHVALEGAL